MPNSVALGVLLANDILGQLHFRLEEPQLGFFASAHQKPHSRLQVGILNLRHQIVFSVIPNRVEVRIQLGHHSRHLERLQRIILCVDLLNRLSLLILPLQELFRLPSVT